MATVLEARHGAQVAKVDLVCVEWPALHVSWALTDSHDQAPDQAARRTSSSESESGVGRNVTKWQLLLVDDERDVRMMLRDLLEFEGYTVSEAANGLEGLEQLRASKSPLIVLLDYKMPRMNGEEMLRAVIADPDLAGRDAFIFVTANLLAFSPELLQLLSVVDIPVIQKPYTLSTLLHEIERASARLEGPGTGPAV